jgi:outer membrane protein OmpA-like peptidoglycan-associated protein
MTHHGLRATAAALVALALTAPAVADDPARRGFDPDPVRPALGLERGFAIESAVPAPAGSLGATLLLDYSEGLLSTRVGDGERSPLLENRLQAHFMAAYALGRLELAIDVPVVLHQEADFRALRDQGVPAGSPLVAPVSGTALGDVRLAAKVPLLAPGRFPVSAAALLDLRAPTGNGDAFYGDGAMAVPSVVLTRDAGPVRIDAQVGYAFRGPGQYAQLVVHDGLTYGVGASMDLPRFAGLPSWRAIAELSGGWPRGNDLDTDRYRAPLALRGGVRAPLADGFALELGAGTGLGEAGYGRESWRVFAAVRWSRPATDRDGDGVLDRRDRCPDVPGEAALDGCTSGDTDLDTVLDPVDLCPQAKGLVELDGCPDRDIDGIPDVQDACPEDPGPAQNEGCPIGEDPVVEIETERLSLKDAINFDTGKASIKPESDHVLAAIAAIIREHPEIRRIRVEGHTDNVGGASYNKDLSQRRAQSVVDHLVEKGGVARERLVPVGYGFERPVASNADPLGRAKNRRVEFTILGDESDPRAAR